MTAKKKEGCVVIVGGEGATKTIDVGKLWPLKWKDVKALQALGVNEAVGADGTDTADKFLGYILRRADSPTGKAKDSTLTDDEIDEITVDDAKKIIAYFSQQQEPDRPS